jgi:hypothetical protein
MEKSTTLGVTSEHSDARLVFAIAELIARRAITKRGCRPLCAYRHRPRNTKYPSVITDSTPA